MSANMPASPGKDLLEEAIEYARSMKVHRRQCILLCTFIQRASEPGTPPARTAEESQQWDEVLRSIHERLRKWGKLDSVEAFFQSEEIVQGIDSLYEELGWCGLKSENAALQLLEKRRQDHASLLETLRSIATAEDQRNKVLQQSPGDIRYFIKALQRTLKKEFNTPAMLQRIESALMFLYKVSPIDIPTPDVTSQIADLSPVSSQQSNPIWSTYHAEWLEQDSVSVKAIRHLRADDGNTVKRFMRDAGRYYSVRHPNIIRVYGLMFDSMFGCSLVSPLVPYGNLNTYLDCCPNTYILPMLSDVASGLQYLHSLEPTIVHGDIRPENVIVMDDGSACISDFGLLTLAGGHGNNLNYFMRWTAPELIRAERKRVQGDAIKPGCTKYTDIYAFGFLLYGKAFTSSVPYSHIADYEVLESEILHGMRPSITNAHKATATTRGWSGEINMFMSSCWDPEPRKRPAIAIVKDALDAEMMVLATRTKRLSVSPPSSIRKRESEISKRSSSSKSFVSSLRMSGQELFPPTPPTDTHRLGDPIIASNSQPSAADPRYFAGDDIYAEPINTGLDEPDQNDMIISHMQKQMSSFSAEPGNNVSERTIRPPLRSSFSSDSDDGHLGQQRESTAYARMPKLRPPSLKSSKRRGSKDRWHILVDKMTESNKLDRNWVGVAPMEELRALTPKQLNRIRVIEQLVQKESDFLSGNVVGDQFARLLRSNPSTIGIDRLEGFLSNVTEDSYTLRLFNQQFRDALKARPNVTVVGFQQVALLCKEAATQFANVYPEYVRHLPEVQETLTDEMSSNDGFAAMMKEKMADGQTLQNSISKFLTAPVTHLDDHPRYIEYIINEMPQNDRDIPALKEALQEMNTAVYLTRLASWQQSESESDSKLKWADFVPPDIPNEKVKVQMELQSHIFKLIADERVYAKTLKIMTKLLQRLQWELVNMNKKEDQPLGDIVKSLHVVMSDISRFHFQLQENFFTIQRTHHPFITYFVSACGLDQVPWLSLYEKQYGELYRKLANLIQEGKVRRAILPALKRITSEANPGYNIEFLNFLRMPSKYLRDLASRLRNISELTPDDNEDKLVLTELWPRLWDVSHNTELKTSASEERARLSRLSAALDLSRYPGNENDIELASNDRALVLSGELTVVSTQGESERSDTLYTILLDNYLLFAKSDESQGILRLNVCEKPMPLALIQYANVEDTATPVDKYYCGTLKYGGTPRRILRLFAGSSSEAMKWPSRLSKAIDVGVPRTSAKKIVELHLLRKFAEAPSCSAEFYYNGLVTAIGCDGPEPGIYLQMAKDVHRRVVSLQLVCRMSAIAELNLLLVLAKNTLFYFRFDELVNLGKTPPQRSIDDNMNVRFYRVGYLPERTFLVVLASKRGKDLIRFYEASGKVRSPGMLKLKSRASPFQLLLDIEGGSNIRDICFLKNRLVLVTDTFQLVDIASVDSIKASMGPQALSLPRPNDPMTTVAERCRRSRPIAVQRVEEEFILCYSDFAAYLNVNGQLSSRTVEWLSDDVKGVAFRMPYMLVVASTVIEVREISTGKLSQIIPVLQDPRASWVGRYSEGSPSNLGMHLVIADSTGQGVGNNEEWFTMHAKTPGGAGIERYSLFRLQRG